METLPLDRAKLLQLASREAINEGGLDFAWRILARPDQQWPGFIPWCADEAVLPDNGWTTWLLLGGRGAGKTRAGAEWVRHAALDPTYLGVKPAKRRIALVAETYADGREVMIEGPSGLNAIGHPGMRPHYEVSRRRLVWPNGAVAYCFSSEDPEGIRGYQFHAAWSDELCKWRHPEETWSNLQLALRLGDRPRQVATTTPRPMGLLKRLLAQSTTYTARASTYDNRAHLGAAFFSEIAAQYEGTALGRQELMGEIVDDVAGALWRWDGIEAARISPITDLVERLGRIVVAVDPPATAGPNADECGIIVAGVYHGDPPTAYVLDDRSAGGLSPTEWAGRAVAAFHDYNADRIVAEVNQGGDMVKAVIAQVDPAAPVRGVRATRGKRLRAEPIAALYEQARVRHVGAFPKLEEQMTSYTGEASSLGASPDRLDALVWALTDLMMTTRAPKPGVRRLG